MEELKRNIGNSLLVVSESLANLPMPSQNAIDKMGITVVGSTCLGGLIIIGAGATAYIAKHCNFEGQYKEAKVKISSL